MKYLTSFVQRSSFFSSSIFLRSNASRIASFSITTISSKETREIFKNNTTTTDNKKKSTSNSTNLNITVDKIKRLRPATTSSSGLNLKEKNSKINDVFKTPTIHTGKYCLRNALENVDVFVNRKVALIVAKTKPDEIIQELRRLGYYCQLYTEFEELPKDYCIKQGNEIFKSLKPGIMIAVGGKDSMDVAKLILLKAEYPEIYQRYLLEDMLTLNKRKVKISFPETKFNHLCPLVFIPGQLSCGAEMKAFAELYVGNELKTPIAVNTCDPDVVIQDSYCIPQFAVNHFISEAFYLFVQAIDAYVSPKVSDRIKLMAKDSAKVLYDNMVQYEKGLKDEKKMISAAKFNDTTIRVSAQVGTCVSNVSSGLTSIMSVVCNGHFNIPEELSASIFMRDVMEYNSSKKEVKQGYIELAEYLELHAQHKRNTIDHFIDEIENLQESLGLPTSIKHIKDINVKDYKNAIPELANSTINMGLSYGAKTPSKADEIEKLFYKSL